MKIIVKVDHYKDKCEVAPEENLNLNYLKNIYFEINY